MKNKLLFTRSLALVAIIVLMMMPGRGWGQQVIGSFPVMDGGYENQTGTLGNSLSATVWSRQSGTGSTINNSGGRSVPKYVSATVAAANRLLQSPQDATAANGPAASTAYLVQFYYKSTANFIIFQIGVTTNGTTNPTYSTGVTLTSTAGVWTKYTGTVTTPGIAPTTAGIGIIRGGTSASGGPIDVDDFVIYAGSSADITAPNSPGIVTVDGATLTSLNIGWVAATGGVDGGGYVVVRYATNPNSDNNPNQNGIYAVGNTTINGTGGLTGTIRYIGTGTSFTDNSGLSSGTQYWYKVYTVDKAFNYSTSSDGNGTTSSASNTAPIVTTQAVSPIGTTTATGNGNITATGGVNPGTRGVCWVLYSSVSDPTISDYIVQETGGSFGTGAYTESMTTNLSVETRYKLKAFATNTVGTGYGSLVNFWTLSAEPLTHSTTFTNSVISQTQINLSFDAASTITNADGYIILQKTGSAPTGTPTDGNAYSVGNTIVDATVAAIITNPASISTSITGLTAGTHYYFTIMPYNYNGSNNETYNYKTDGSVPGTNGTTSPPNDADSYVSAPTTQANPVTISSLADTDPESVEVFKFKINDVGTDGLMTKVTQVSISAGTNNNAVWSSTIQGAKLSIDGGSTFVTTGSATIGTSSVVFPISVGNLNITNGSNATVSLFIYLKSSGLTDKQVLEFNIPTTSHGFTADATGSTFLTTFATATTSNQISIDVTGTKFNFATQPSNTTVNTNFSTAVEAVDANNNRDLEATTSVTLGASAGTLSSVTGLTKSLVAGLFSWTDLQNNTAGTGVTLSATGTLTTANSNSFRILSAIPTTQASAIVFSNVGMTTMTVSWTNGNGANRILVGKATGTPGTPTNGTSYTASTVFGSGGTFGANEYVLYNGFGSTVDITGLTGSTTYTFKVFEFNGSSGTENYITTSNATSQATTGLTYYSNGSGDPATLTNWKTNRDGTGTSPANFVSGETFTIESPDNMTTTATWAISGTNSKLHIENGGTLTANHAITLTAATTFQIDNLGTYIHNNISAFGTTIFQGTESFASNSTVEFKDWNSTGPSVSAWGNVKFNATGAVAGSMQLSGNMTVINGNLEIIATGSTPRDIRFATTQAPTITISGYFTQNAGTVNLATTSGITVFNVAGNFAVNGGTFTSTSTGSKVVFNGSGVQNFMNAGTISIVNFEVGSTSTLNMGTQVLPGGSFTLPSGATLKTAHTSGINGSITSPAPALNTGANYDFNGASSQVTGALLPATINNLTIDNAAGVTLSNAALTVSGTMTINSGKLFTLGSSKQLTVSGALTNSATESGLVIESGGSLIHNSANVPATVKREIPKDNTWHFLSSPVSAQAICDGNYAPTTGNFTDIIGATYDFFKWSEPTVAESKNWLNLKNTDWTLNTTDFGATPQFTPKTGYLVAYNGTFAGSATKSFAGSLNTGDQSFALTTGGNTWNLIGNPFPSAIDWDAVTKTVLADGYYNIYNEAKSGGAGYESYLDVTHKTAGANGKIAATQGFFVKAASTPLDIPNTARVHDNNWLKSSESNPVNQLKLKLGNAVNYDEALIIFEANGSLNKGWYDASKLFSMNVEVPQVYTMKDNGRICINSLPATNDPITVPVGMLIPSDGNYTLDLSGIESFSSRPGIILEDLKTNTTQNMVQTPVYSFSASKTDDPKRFLLHFALAIGINDKTTSQPFHVIASDNSLFIVDNTGNNKGEVSIYNMMGQLILRKPLSENPLTRLNFDGVTGYYIVKVITQNNLFTCKVFFN